jgi:glyoxylase-like metal-dependent hydrolase (beta-lactamase superfamily II)
MQESDGVRPIERHRTWRIGEVTVTRIVEQVDAHEIQALFPAATTAEVVAIDWLQPHFLTPDGRALLSIHALVIETPSKRVIVDTCVGNDKARVWQFFDHLQMPFLEDLEAAGFPPESFDLVLCTHLHVDHVGWNTRLSDGRWVPTFPNARYLISRKELDHWGNVTPTAGDSWIEIQRQSFADSVQPILDAGLAELVDSPHQVCEEVSLIPTPGHSPGHVSIRVRSQGQEALITGDMSHHPSQLVHLDWGLPIDFDGKQATRTREQVFADAAARSVLVIGTHWAGAGGGRVRKEDGRFRLDV